MGNEKKVKQHLTLLPQNCFQTFKRDDLFYEIKLSDKEPSSVNYEDLLFIFYILKFHPIQCSRATQGSKVIVTMVMLKCKIAENLNTNYHVIPEVLRELNIVHYICLKVYSKYRRLENKNIFDIQ